jgi:DNA-binding MarR family transcriptional regulator
LRLAESYDMNNTAPGSPCYSTALRKAARNVSRIYDRGLRASGLRGTQFAVLAELARHKDEPPTMNQLADYLVMDRSTLGHNLRPLERRGFVAITVDEEDQRTRRIALSAEGAAKFGEASRLWNQAQERYEKALGPQNAVNLREVLYGVAALDLR